MRTSKNRIDSLFASKQQELLSIFVTAGYPKKDSCPTILEALDNAGVDMIEVGMPYSDPLADGPTIQESSKIALQNGIQLQDIFDQIASVRQKVKAPILLMGYYNQVLTFGIKAFANACNKAGVDGLIIPDLPVDHYQQETQGIFEAHNIHINFLIGPESTANRIKKADQMSKGFVYVVAQHGITGSSYQGKSQTRYYEHIQSLSLEKPQLIGFGIHDAKSFSEACQQANGAIIGSAFIRHLKQEGSNAQSIQQFIQTLRP